MRVMVQLRGSAELVDAASGADIDFTAAASPAPAFTLDNTFHPVEIGTPIAGAIFASTSGALSFDEPDLGYIVRGELPDDNESAYASLVEQGNVTGVYADPAIEPTIICPGDGPQGDVRDVASQLGVDALAAAGLDGSGVRLAIVDTGINIAHLVGKGQNPTLDAALSWAPPGVGTAPGQAGVGHGTMCAFDAGIAAPKAMLLDHSLLLSTTSGGSAMGGLLSDAVRSYNVLLQALLNGTIDRIVVNNSWGMFNPDGDFPIGHAGNYSDNSRHPFNVIVSALEAQGADILFAAGNCGRDCPDGRCNFVSKSINGANSHPAVSSIAGVDTTRLRVGYSSQGPGRLSSDKPDFSAYTHFLGSEAFGPGTADGGTSAACPVAAGVVAAVRTKYSPTDISPAQLRKIIHKTAADLGTAGFDFDSGWGVIDAAALVQNLATAKPTAPAWPGRYLKQPPTMRGTDVQTWQAQMARAGFKLEVDGYYGKQSAGVCQDLQERDGLEVDGIVGPVTWAASWGNIPALA